MSKRPLNDWADLMYDPDVAPLAHVVPFNNGIDGRSLCGEWPKDTGWYGTGDWDERETAYRLPVCPDCTARLAALGDQVRA